jgi:hypothetical protein
MTDHDDPLHPLDELASAHLDGLTTPAEAARVDADPDLAARVARLAATRDAVRSPDAGSDPARRDEAIAAALDAFDAAGEEGPASAGTAVSPSVTSLTARPAHARRALRLVGIAAAVALLALAVPLLGRLDTGSDDDTATSSFEETGAALDDSTAADAAGGDVGAAASTTVATGSRATDLGSFAALPDLAAAVRAGVGSKAAAMESSPMAATTDSTVACEPEQRDAGSSTAYVALAELDGQPVVVLVRDEPDGTRTMVVLDRQDCSTISAGRL